MWAELLGELPADISSSPIQRLRALKKFSFIKRWDSQLQCLRKALGDHEIAKNAKTGEKRAFLSIFAKSVEGM